MSITYTPLLGLAQPTPGTESGTWGTTINDSLTALLETAIAGSKTADVTSSNWTLTDIDGADDTARAAVLIPTGTNGATTRSILAPNQSKLYVIINQATGSVVIKGVTGPTTGVTIPTGKTTLVAWGGSDFVEITPSTISGTLPVANGGTGVTASTGSGSVVLSTSPTFPAQTNFTANSTYNIYASGTGTNLFTGAVQVGSTAFNGATLSLTRNITGGGGSYGYAIRSTGQIQSDVTTELSMYDTLPSTVATAFTLASLSYFRAAQGTIGAGSTVTNQYGFYADSSLTGATNNYGFYGGIASGTNKYNLYMAGTADNYLASNLGIGANAGNIGGLSGYISLNVGADLTGSTNATGIWQNSQVKSGVTNAAYGFRNSGSTQAATFTLPSYAHFSATSLTVGAGSTVAAQYGFRVSDLTSASTNIGFSGGVTAGTGKYNLNMSGSADNLLNGPLSIGTGNPANASSLLDVQSTTKGVRFPNMTTTQKNAIATPAAGLMVFDTTLSKLCVYSGSAWETVSST